MRAGQRIAGGSATSLKTSSAISIVMSAIMMTSRRWPVRISSCDAIESSRSFTMSRRRFNTYVEAGNKSLVQAQTGEEEVDTCEFETTLERRFTEVRSPTSR
eukprot:scaffold324083_cov66-Tisochrysis_lutea.AAC.1